MTAPTADELREAARASVQIKPDPQTGIRPGDPLPALVPDVDLYAEMVQTRAAVERVTGVRVPLIQGTVGAHIRSELRRWAMRDDAARIAAEQDWADAIAAVDEADAAVVAARRALEDAEAAQRAAMKRADEIANPEGVR